MTLHERERLSAWLDGELSPDERAEVEAHLAACEECAALLAEMGAVDELARELPVEAPAGYFETFPAGVRSRIEGRAPRNDRGSPATSGMYRGLPIETHRRPVGVPLPLSLVRG